MKRWQETGEIFGRLADLTESGQHAAIACVVNIAGSAYRRPGARFLIAPDGSTAGGISGGCLEEDVRRTGLDAIGDGTCRLLHYETGTDDDPLWGLGLGCNGEVDVFVAPTSRPGLLGAFAHARGLFAGDAPFTMITLIADETSADRSLEGRVFLTETDAGQHPHAVDRPDTGNAALDAELAAAATAALADGRSSVVEVDGVRAFVEVFSPPPDLVVCGAGDDAMPLVASAAAVGFRVVVVDHRPAYLARERFPSARRLVQARPDDDAGAIPVTEDTFVVLKTHNLERDKAWARRFVDSPVPYLGLLGPRARCEEIAEEAGAADRSRIFGPVGLDLGAEGPEQVGMAVVAELLAVRSGRRPDHLRDREAPIHDRQE